LIPSEKPQLRQVLAAGFTILRYFSAIAKSAPPAFRVDHRNRQAKASTREVHSNGDPNDERKMCPRWLRLIALAATFECERMGRYRLTATIEIHQQLLAQNQRCFDNPLHESAKDLGNQYGEKTNLVAACAMPQAIPDG
jgi:hypothetical protein